MLKDRASHRRNLSSAVIAGIHRTPADAVVLALLLALVAIGDIAGEALLHQVLKASCVIRELTVKIVDRIPEMLRDGLSLIHGRFFRSRMYCLTRIARITPHTTAKNASMKVGSLASMNTVCHLFYVM